MVPWAHSSPQTKRHLDRFSYFLANVNKYGYLKDDCKTLKAYFIGAADDFYFALYDIARLMKAVYVNVANAASRLNGFRAKCVCMTVYIQVVLGTACRTEQKVVIQQH